jgi:hypothetical protein
MTPEEVKTMGDMQISAVECDENESEHIKAFMDHAVRNEVKVPLDRNELEILAKAWYASHLAQQSCDDEDDDEKSSSCSLLNGLGKKKSN